VSDGGERSAWYDTVGAASDAHYLCCLYTKRTACPMQFRNEIIDFFLRTPSSAAVHPLTQVPLSLPCRSIPSPSRFKLRSSAAYRTTHACDVSHNWILYTPGRYRPTSGRICEANRQILGIISTYLGDCIDFPPTVCKLSCHDVSTREGEILRSWRSPSERSPNYNPARQFGLVNSTRIYWRISFFCRNYIDLIH